MSVFGPFEPSEDQRNAALAALYRHRASQDDRKRILNLERQSANANEEPMKKIQKRSVARVGAGKKTGYVYVHPKEVDSILQHGYLSVREQINRGITNEDALFEKYGRQFSEAQKLYEDCPSNIVSYLDWRTGDTNDGAKSIYYLTSPLTSGPYTSGCNS